MSSAAATQQQIRYPAPPKATTTTTTATTSEYTPLPTSFAPGPNDIVCGRGRGYYNCQGNVQFRATVKQFVEYYLKQPNKSSKTAVLEEIVQYCQQHDQAKFVKQTAEGWMELSDLCAREKVGNAMREAISARNAQQAQQQQKQEVQQAQQAPQPTTRPQFQAPFSTRQQPIWQRKAARNQQQTQQQQTQTQPSFPRYRRQEPVPQEPISAGHHPGMPAPQPMVNSTLSTGSATASGRHEVFGKKIAFLNDSQVYRERENSLFMKNSTSNHNPLLSQQQLQSPLQQPQPSPQPRRHSGTHAQPAASSAAQAQTRPPLRRSSSMDHSLSMPLSNSIQMAHGSTRGAAAAASMASSFNQSVVMNLESILLPQGGSSEFILTNSVNSTNSNASSIISQMTTDTSASGSLMCTATV